MNQSTIPSLLIIEFRWSSQELINRSLVEVWASDVESDDLSIFILRPVTPAPCILQSWSRYKESLQD